MTGVQTCALPISPDHLDRYDGFEAYAASKARLFEMQSSRNVAIASPPSLPDPNVRALGLTVEIGGEWTESIVSWWKQNEIWPSLAGPHNAENASAAICVSNALGIDEHSLKEALRSYPGLPHRMERVREKDGILYVNDSKATNPTSTAPALAAYPVIHWILGGQAKTNELDACIPHLSHVKTAFTIGRDSSMLATILRDKGVAVAQSITLEQAVKRASITAKAGDTVLLSPACASFDQFRDFEDRGDQFRALVEAL